MVDAIGRVRGIVDIVAVGHVLVIAEIDILFIVGDVAVTVIHRVVTDQGVVNAGGPVVVHHQNLSHSQ